MHPDLRTGGRQLDFGAVSVNSPRLSAEARKMEHRHPANPHRSKGCPMGAQPEVWAPVVEVVYTGVVMDFPGFRIRGPYYIGDLSSHPEKHGKAAARA